MRGGVRRWTFAAIAACAFAAVIPVIAAAKHDTKKGSGGGGSAIKHVLLISVDGLHQ
jgi:hypothetical protein